MYRTRSTTCLLSDVIQYLFIPSAFHPIKTKTKKKTCNFSTCTHTVVATLKLFQAAGGIEVCCSSEAELCLCDERVKEDSSVCDLLRAVFWRVCVWSRACDNELCSCHHTLCSLRRGALQWKSCKESQRFNYPFHFIHICLHTWVILQ